MDYKIKSLAVVPYVESLSLFVKNIIEDYSYIPEKIEYVPNDKKNSWDKNLFDYKALTAFQKYNPSEFFICHASDHYLNPEDLEYMIKRLQENENAYCIGLQPLSKTHHANFGDTFTNCARVNVWNAKCYREHMQEGVKLAMEKHGHFGDVQNFIGQCCFNDGLIPLQATRARMFSVDLTD